MKSFALIIGVLLIVFGVLAIGSTAAMNAQSERNGVPADQRFWNAVGGALCTLMCVGGGTLLVFVGSRKPKRMRSRPRDGENERDDKVPRPKRPWDADRK